MVVGAGVPGVEHLPAALAGRGLLGAAGADGAPVDRREIDVHAEPLEEIGGDVALRLGDRLVLGDEAGDRLAGIAGFREQLLGRIEVARALEDVAALLGVERRCPGVKNPGSGFHSLSSSPTMARM